MRRPFVAIIAAWGFLCAALLGFSPSTRVGVQCPTAPVQTVAVRDCCDHVVFRAPRPGDKAFVQCRCAERKASSAKATSGQKLTLFLTAQSAWSVTAVPRVLWVGHPYADRVADWRIAPPTRPPTFA